MTILYGIPNCDTVKKAQKWLNQNNTPFTFHDYRKDGLDESLLLAFLEKTEWTELLNKRSTSYRALSAEQKDNMDQESAILLFIEFPTLIKRPLLIHNDHAILGFKPEQYQTFFSA